MVSDLEESCSVDFMATSAKPIRCGTNCTYKGMHDLMAYGFELFWGTIVCQQCKGQGFCFLDGDVVYGCDDRCGFKCKCY